MAKKPRKPTAKNNPTPPARMTWFNALQSVKPYVFKISTPSGTGTGFQITYGSHSKLCGIATAYHVIAYEYKWGYPIEVTHFDSKESLILEKSDRAIFIHPESDLAFILFDAKNLPVKTDPPKLIDPKLSLVAGVEVGWCGFPSVAVNDLCFFNGYISCNLNSDSYLVDGVAINGVSGGPAFWITYDTSEVKICGVVSAYYPNTATGAVLPGLSMLKSVEPYQKDLESFNTFDAAQAAAKKEEEEKKKKGQIPTPSVSLSPSQSPSPSPSPSPSEES